MGVDYQIQIYILAGVFGFVSIILIFFLAGICGQLSKLKRQHRKLHFDHIGQTAGYDNYAYNSRTIQPDEELNRRYTMYDPYRNSNQGPNVHQISNDGKYSRPKNSTQPNNAIEVNTVEGSRDAASEYSIVNSETVVMTGNDVEMKIRSINPEFRGIPPPPAFVNRFESSSEPNSSRAKTADR